MESSPRPWMGGHVPWMRTPSMDLSTSRVQHIQKPPSVYFIPFCSPRPLFPYYWPTPPVDFSPYLVDNPRVTGSTSMCKDLWMGIIHPSRATVRIIDTLVGVEAKSKASATHLKADLTINDDKRWETLRAREETERGEGMEFSADNAILSIATDIRYR